MRRQSNVEVSFDVPRTLHHDRAHITICWRASPFGTTVAVAEHGDRMESEGSSNHRDASYAAFKVSVFFKDGLKIGKDISKVNNGPVAGYELHAGDVRR